MKKANLSCPREKVFFNELLVYRPAIPGSYVPRPDETLTVQVDVLEVNGEQALVRLPSIMERETATINVEFLC